jgi:electron-transferring-flavoprotein dehydrogenase
VIEKGAYIGAHILSGNVFQPTALKELFPDFESLSSQPPLTQPVTRDVFKFLTENKSYTVPNALLPSNLHNDGNYIISLSDMCKWLET